MGPKKHWAWSRSKLWHSGGIPERFFWKSYLKKKKKKKKPQTTKTRKIDQSAKGYGIIGTCCLVSHSCPKSLYLHKILKYLLTIFALKFEQAHLTMLMYLIPLEKWQTVQILIRHHTVWHLIYVCIVSSGLFVPINHYHFLGLFSRWQYFSQKTGFHISCKLSPKETLCMKCQTCFLGKMRKNISKCWLMKLIFYKVLW